MSTDCFAPTCAAVCNVSALSTRICNASGAVLVVIALAAGVCAHTGDMTSTLERTTIKKEERGNAFMNGLIVQPGCRRR
jgi:hypothetical protein